jgi:hypothetical protein
MEKGSGLHMIAFDSASSGLALRAVLKHPESSVRSNHPWQISAHLLTNEYIILITYSAMSYIEV